MTSSATPSSPNSPLASDATRTGSAFAELLSMSMSSSIFGEDAASDPAMASRTSVSEKKDAIQAGAILGEFQEPTRQSHGTVSASTATGKKSLKRIEEAQPNDGAARLASAMFRSNGSLRHSQERSVANLSLPSTFPQSVGMEGKVRGSESRLAIAMRMREETADGDLATSQTFDANVAQQKDANSAPQFEASADIPAASFISPQSSEAVPQLGNASVPFGHSDLTSSSTSTFSPRSTSTPTSPTFNSGGTAESSTFVQPSSTIASSGSSRMSERATPIRIADGGESERTASTAVPASHPAIQKPRSENSAAIGTSASKLANSNDDSNGQPILTFATAASERTVSRDASMDIANRNATPAPIVATNETLNGDPLSNENGALASTLPTIQFLVDRATPTALDSQPEIDLAPPQRAKLTSVAASNPLPSMAVEAPSLTVAVQAPLEAFRSTTVRDLAIGQPSRDGQRPETALTDVRAPNNVKKKSFAPDSLGTVPSRHYSPPADRISAGGSSSNAKQAKENALNPTADDMTIDLDTGNPVLPSTDDLSAALPMISTDSAEASPIGNEKDNANPKPDRAGSVSGSSARKDDPKNLSLRSSNSVSDGQAGNSAVPSSGAATLNPLKTVFTTATSANLSSGADTSSGAAGKPLVSEPKSTLPSVERPLKDAFQAGAGEVSSSSEPHTSSISSAHLTSEVNKSGVKIAFQGEQLGNVELRAKITGDRVSASITVDRHETHALLTSDLPVLQQSMNQRQLRVNEIMLLHNSSSADTSSGSGLPEKQEHATHQQELGTSDIGGEGQSIRSGAGEDLGGANRIFDSKGRLSVRA